MVYMSFMLVLIVFINTNRDQNILECSRPTPRLKNLQAYYQSHIWQKDNT